MPFDMLITVYCLCGTILAAYGIFLSPSNSTIIQLVVGGFILFIGWPIIVSIMIYNIMTDDRF